MLARLLSATPAPPERALLPLGNDSSVSKAKDKSSWMKPVLHTACLARLRASNQCEASKPSLPRLLLRQGSVI